MDWSYLDKGANICNFIGLSAAIEKQIAKDET